MAFFVRPFTYITSRIVIRKNFHLNQILQKSCNIDKIDCFTTDLVREKTLKWNNLFKVRDESLNYRNVSFKFLLKAVINDIENVDSLDSIELDISKLTQHQLNSLIIATIKSKNEIDFYYIIKQCLKKKILPDITDCLAILSIKGDVELISELEELHIEMCGKQCSTILLYKGYGYWIKGNVNWALDVFKNFYLLYAEHDMPKNNIHRILKLVTNDTFNGKGEAILYCLLNFAKDLQLNFNDMFLLGYIWKKAFKSEWFSDQNLSMSIFHEDEKFREVVYKGSIKICDDFLKENNTEAVYRLIELFLKYEKKEAYENCLKLLFDYYYYERNVRACSEIMKCFKNLNIPTSTLYNEKLLDLLVNQNITCNKLHIMKLHKFQYRF